MPKKLTHDMFIQKLEGLNRQRTKKVYLLQGKYINQNHKLWFQCNKGHQWCARPSNILSGQGCKTCKIHEDSSKKRANYKDLIKDFRKIHGRKYQYVKETYVSKMKQMEIKCPKHGSFYMKPFDHLDKHKECPSCKKEKENTEKYKMFVERAKKIHSNKYKYDRRIIENNKISITCPKHGRFLQRKNDHLNGHGCPKCARVSISIKQITWLEWIMKNEGIFIQHAYNIGEHVLPELNTKVDGFCKETSTVFEFHGDAFHGNLQRYNDDDTPHPFKKHLTARLLYETTTERDKSIEECGYKLRKIWESEFDELQIEPLNIDYSKIVHQKHNPPTHLLDQLKIQLVDPKFKGFKHKHVFKCLLCGEIFNSTLTQRKQSFKKYNSVGCPTCSKMKIDYTFVNVVLRDIRKNIAGNWNTYNNVVCCDINKIAIVVVDVNDKSNINKRNKNKVLQQQFTNRGYNCFVLFSDEFIQLKKLIINKIKHYTNQNRSKRIHARKCKIKQIDNTQKGEFLNNFHIQGNDNSQINYGAFFKDDLVAVMTFCKPRVALGYKNKDGYSEVFELSRFATNIEYRIPGIASKMLKNFQRENKWQHIISYADKRWSSGNLYKKLGFECRKDNPPDYFYVIDGERKHRWNYRKDKLKTFLPEYDPQLTEYQNMEKAGYWRVWGCGTMRYVLDKHS